MVVDDESLAVKLALLKPHLNERQWRLLLRVEAEAIGRGGIALVARLSGSSRTTVQTAVNEIRAGVEPADRVRAAGAGRPALEDAQPGIELALEDLVGPESRGDPVSPLRWTTKSLAKLSKGLALRGFRASTRTVSRLLAKAGYRLQAVFKTKEGAQHPDRDAQFGHINSTAAQVFAAGDPVISIDTKKKDLVGEYAKWNKVEHRLFSFISVNWRGRPLTDYQVIIETIAATTTGTGLTVQAVLDPHEYPTGVKISKAEFDAVPITRHDFHGDWNYTIHPEPRAPLE